MRGMNTTQHDYHVGMRLVTARDRTQGLDGVSRFREMRIETVEDIDREAIGRGHNAVMTLRHGEDTRRVILCYTSIAEDAPMRVVWSDPLPDDDEAALALVAGAYADPASRRAALFWVGAVADQVAYCHLVTDDLHGDQGLQPVGGRMSASAKAIAIGVWNGAARGDLITGLLADATKDKGLTVHRLKGVATVMSGVSLEDAAPPMAERSRRRGFGWSNFMGMDQIEEMEDRAHQATLRSEALVLRWMDGDREQTRVVSSTGLAFHHVDDAECYVEDSIPGVGLWMFENARLGSSVSYEGEHDSWMEGRARPATAQDVASMFGSTDDLDRELIDIMDETEGQATTLGLIEAAREVQEVEDAEVARKARMATDAKLAEGAPSIL